MRKIKEILRLYYEQKLVQRMIDGGVNDSQSAVHKYLSRAKAAVLSWPLDQEWDDRLKAALFPPNQEPKRLCKWPMPDFLHIRQQLERHRDLTIELLRNEYREQHPD